MLTFDMPGGRIGREPLGDHENIKLEVCRHGVDLVTDRARITIDVNVSQLSARFLLGVSPP